MQTLERQGRLNRAIEFLPSDEEITRRKAHKQTSPHQKTCGLGLRMKMAVFDEWWRLTYQTTFFSRALKAYFPKILSEKFPEAIANHQLKREIIATFITNTVVNRTGATFVNFIATEAAASAADVIRALR